MKLNSVLVERTLSQLDARVIPDDHPVVPQLNRMFGEHTFFLDGNGLNIVESEPGVEHAAKVVNVANWEDDNRSTLAPHEPQVTDVEIELDARKTDGQ